MYSKSSAFHYVKKNFDEGAIVAALASLAMQDTTETLSEQDALILAALRRANSSLAEQPIADIQAYLASLSGEQIPGLVSNIKGIMHEMEFVQLENDDGDSIYASMFGSPNHPDTDVLFTDTDTGDSWEIQLKATDNAAYVQDWIDTHPDGEIVVTEELAQQMDLPSSGIANEELTTDVSDFVSRMIEQTDTSDIWDFFPAISLVSTSIIAVELWRRYQRSEIDFTTFKRLIALSTGLKFTKIAALSFLLSVPVLGQVTGAVVVAGLLLSAKSTWFDRPPKFDSSKLITGGSSATNA